MLRKLFLQEERFNVTSISVISSNSWYLVYQILALHRHSTTMLLHEENSKTTPLSPGSHIEILNPNEPSNQSNTAKSSPLAMLAATCSNIGKDTPVSPTQPPTSEHKRFSPYSLPQIDNHTSSYLTAYSDMSKRMADAKVELAQLTSKLSEQKVSPLDRLALFKTNFLPLPIPEANNSCGKCKSPNSSASNLFTPLTVSTEKSSPSYPCNWVNDSGVACGKCFSSVDQLLGHIRVDHAESETNSYTNPLLSLSNLSKKTLSSPITPLHPFTFAAAARYHPYLGASMEPSSQAFPFSTLSALNAAYLYPNPYLLYNSPRA